MPVCRLDVMLEIHGYEDQIGVLFVIKVTSMLYVFGDEFVLQESFVGVSSERLQRQQQTNILDLWK